MHSSRSFLVLVFLAIACGVLTAAEPAAAADRLWAELQALVLEQPPIAQNGEHSHRTDLQWREKRDQIIQRKGEAFLADFPADPRRWQVALLLLENPQRFITSWAGADRSPPIFPVDHVAEARWIARAMELRDAALRAPEVTAEQREQFVRRAFTVRLGPALVAASTAQSVEWEPLVADGLELAARYPQNTQTAAAIRLLLHAYSMVNPPTATVAIWRRFSTSPNAAVAQAAAAALKSAAQYDAPIELAFTALDGRAIDLAQFRGKVVLLDFWATWCGPCLAELPTLLRVYSAHHAQGFEIIGISCDTAPNPAKPSASARTGAQVLEFASRHGMTWPQHYEGRKHNAGGNTLAARFAVTGIPATFLLDRTGRVVATNLRGERLAAEVGRLMEQP